MVGAEYLVECSNAHILVVIGVWNDVTDVSFVETTGTVVACYFGGHVYGCVWCVGIH